MPAAHWLSPRSWHAQSASGRPPGPARLGFVRRGAPGVGGDQPWPLWAVTPKRNFSHGNIHPWQSKCQRKRRIVLPPDLRRAARPDTRDQTRDQTRDSSTAESRPSRAGPIVPDRKVIVRFNGDGRWDDGETKEESAKTGAGAPFRQFLVATCLLFCSINYYVRLPVNCGYTTSTLRIPASGYCVLTSTAVQPCASGS
ncbi:hypothetical protein BDV11DRAFT_162390 [Aspergillus similis]